MTDREKLRRLEEAAELRGITIIDYPLKGLRGVTVERDGQMYIGIRPNLTDAERVEVLAHELGHCITGELYGIRSENRHTSETKANEAARYILRHL